MHYSVLFCLCKYTVTITVLKFTASIPGADNSLSQQYLWELQDFHPFISVLLFSSTNFLTHHCGVFDVLPLKFLLPQSHILRNKSNQ